MLKPGCGWLPADWMPIAALRRTVRSLARADDAVLTDYGNTRGSSALRRLLARQFATEGIDAGADQILLTSSGTQAIDLICRYLLQPGDAVLVDDPCYFNFQALLRAHRAKIVGVPYTPTGPDPVLFADALAAYRPRLYITNSALHNPTGATISAQTAFKLLNAAASHDVTIVEDDIFADFEPEPSPRLAAFDGLSRVIRIEAFQDPIRLDPLRLHRGASRLDRGADRPSGRDQLRRAEPGRRRTGRFLVGRRQLSQTHRRPSPAAVHGATGRRRKTRRARRAPLDRAARQAIICGVACRRPGRRRGRPHGTRRKSSARSRQRLQPLAIGIRVHALQRCPDDRPARV